ncbi:hypothetical protein L3Y34_009398 [Caenorhabditis briggsae]|uniref:Uncharacterized protein n=1 Tax=Caenorhabditis briggsae TaxID=6238 RepID=A0AAE9A5A8_CAEBR|nr:hypothetical protein L3Y34_009398 [Caenorhabditis briggsae]
MAFLLDNLDQEWMNLAVIISGLHGPGTLRISPSILQLLIASWAGCYLIIVSFIAVQFVYRYLFLSGNKKADCFDGFGATFLICMSSQPVDYTDSYIKAEDLLPTTTSISPNSAYNFSPEMVPSTAS